jgi:hypothetical protein
MAVRADVTSDVPLVPTPKVCSRCGKPKPATADYFPRDRRAACGLQSKCLECNRVVSRAHFQTYRSK